MNIHEDDVMVLCVVEIPAFFHHFLWEKLFGQDFKFCTHLKIHTLILASFLLESGQPVGVYGGPTDSSTWKAGPP